VDRTRNYTSFSLGHPQSIPARQAFLAVRSKTSKITKRTQGENTFKGCKDFWIVAMRLEPEAQALI